MFSHSCWLEINITHQAGAHVLSQVNLNFSKKLSFADFLAFKFVCFCRLSEMIRCNPVVSCRQIYQVENTNKQLQKSHHYKPLAYGRMKWSPECETSQRNKVSSDRSETPRCNEEDGRKKQRRLKEEERSRRRRRRRCKQMEKLSWTR